MAGAEGSKPINPQDKSKTGDSNVSGTQSAFSATSSGSEIQAEGVIINSGYAAGNPNHTAVDQNPPEGCSGTNNAFDADSGGKINITRATVNSGTYSGPGAPPEVTVRHVVGQHVAPQGKQ